VPGDGPVRLQQHGVYLITGGLGGVGLTLAEYLARAVGARLVLTGRHGLPDKTEWAKYVASHGDDDRTSRQIHVVDALERAGAEVMVAAVDVSNVAQMRALVEEIRRKYGRLDGVIHAAGVPGGGVIQLKTTEAAAQVLAPKVGGTQAVSQAVAGVDLDFFILCSSSISIFGGGGQVDYCAANAYLDAFAHEYTRRTGTYTVAINWDAWQGVGMAVNTAAGISGQIAREREELLRRGIRPDEGVEAFRRILTHCTIPQIVVSTTSLEPYIRKTRGPAKPAVAAAAVSRHARPELATSFAAPDGEIEEAIAEVWKELLGISQVGRHDNFFDLGGHSLLATQLTSRLKGELGIALRLASVFAAPTVAGMAELLLEQMLAEQGTEVQDELLDEVQGRKPS
jgi:NAD(P)-dependent dehydrogenase (short-subunit alcohol dehydrogenase family)